MTDESQQEAFISLSIHPDAELIDTVARLVDPDAWDRDKGAVSWDQLGGEESKRRRSEAKRKAHAIISVTRTADATTKPEWQPTHRHYKGGLYRVLFEAIHSETEELMTIYQTPDGRQWARPAAMFNETLPDGRQRFEAIKKGDHDG